MAFQYIAVEGPIGAGKTTLAERLATRLDAAAVLEERENPFLDDFYTGRPGAAGSARRRSAGGPASTGGAGRPQRRRGPRGA